MELPRMMLSKFRNTLARELEVSEPTILTSDGEDRCVFMGIEEFGRMLPFKQGGQMCRIQGKMFREVM